MGCDYMGGWWFKILSAIPSNIELKLLIKLNFFYFILFKIFSEVKVKKWKYIAMLLSSLTLPKISGLNLFQQISSTLPLWYSFSCNGFKVNYSLGGLLISQ